MMLNEISTGQIRNVIAIQGNVVEVHEDIEQKYGINFSENI
jgi:hypothetical protein